MPKLTDFAAIIFDLDGLLLDTEPTYFAAWQATVEAMGYKIEAERYQTLSGYHYQGVTTALQGWLGQGFDVAVFDQLSIGIWRNYIRKHGIAVKPGVTALLDYADQHGVPYCVATNSMVRYAQECLTVAGLMERFPVLVTRSDVGRAKPEPDIFLKAAEQMQVDIRHCIIFEDSHTGVVAATRAGGFTAYVPSTFPVDPLTVELCDCLLNDLTQVFETFA